MSQVECLISLLMNFFIHGSKGLDGGHFAP